MNDAAYDDETARNRHSRGSGVNHNATRGLSSDDSRQDRVSSKQYLDDSPDTLNRLVAFVVVFD